MDGQVELMLHRRLVHDDSRGVNIKHNSLYNLDVRSVGNSFKCKARYLVCSIRTLSPMDSFSSDFGVHVETCMEDPHVIDVGSRLWSAVVSTIPRNYQFNESYKTADAYTFQDELSASLEEICKIAPSAALVFFSSYSLMDKLCKRWSEKG